MITNNRYFENDLNAINAELYNENLKLHIEPKPHIYNFKPESLTEQYKNLTNKFPYEIISSSNKLCISFYPLELNYLIYKFTEGDKSLPIELINKTKSSRENYIFDNEDRYVVYDLLENYFHSIVYNYSEFLKTIREEHFFNGITDETIILKNLLILYKSVLSDNSIQINIFFGITLTKKISDMIIKMLVDFIEQRLEVLTPELDLAKTNYKVNLIENKTKKIKWLGTQQDLVELFHTLIEKNWIEEANYNKRIEYVNSILNLFDIEHTKRNKKSDSKNSFYKKFNGEIINGIRKLPFLEKMGYMRKFMNIENNS